MQQSRLHRHLPSFPTRRSSDLGMLVSLWIVPALKYPPNPPAVSLDETIKQRTLLYVLLVVLSAALFVQQGRSEEHTSELQSRRDLVCRLLLEKKNSRGRFNERI